jgi:hypothetical protein
MPLADQHRQQMTAEVTGSTDHKHWSHGEVVRRKPLARIQPGGAFIVGTPGFDGRVRADVMLLWIMAKGCSAFGLHPLRRFLADDAG